MPAIGDMILTVSEADNARTIRLTREEARLLIDEISHEELSTALDYAQGDVAKGPQHILIRVVNA